MKTDRAATFVECQLTSCPDSSSSINGKHPDGCMQLVANHKKTWQEAAGSSSAASKAVLAMFDITNRLHLGVAQSTKQLYAQKPSEWPICTIEVITTTGV